MGADTARPRMLDHVISRTPNALDKNSATRYAAPSAACKRLPDRTIATPEVSGVAFGHLGVRIEAAGRRTMRSALRTCAGGRLSRGPTVAPVVRLR